MTTFADLDDTQAAAYCENCWHSRPVEHPEWRNDSHLVVTCTFPVTWTVVGRKHYCGHWAPISSGGAR